MKYLRQYIRQILQEVYELDDEQISRKFILESFAKDEFEKEWDSSHETEQQIKWNALHSMVGTFHKDKLRAVKGMEYDIHDLTDDEIETLFKGKRDLKRLWNEIIDNNNLRGFWENNPDIKFFHSLTYYGGRQEDRVDSLQQNIDDEPLNLSVSAFLKKYKIKDNKDEMSTFGVHKGKSVANRREREEGFILKGRVTMASSGDAFTESRSKGSPTDMSRHQGSGMPKRIVPSPENISRLLFDESDIKGERIGECILDNWSIVGYVYNPDQDEEQLEATLNWCAQNGIKIYTKDMIFS